MEDPSRLEPPPVIAGVSTSGLQKNWPLNSWWVAAHGSEVTEKPALRWILEMPLALYRKSNGEPVALHNRCPHRWAPLSMGEVVGDDLVCPYHGLQFNPLGKCVKVPTQSTTPAAIHVRSYPCVERYGFVWVWTGDVSKADPALIPADLAYLSDPKWQIVWGYKSVNGNYMQLKENVLDLTHFAFLHKKSLGVSGWDRPPEVRVEGSRVTYLQKFNMVPLPAIYAIPAGKVPGKPMNRDNWGSLLTPGAHHGAVEVHDHDPEPNGLVDFKLYIVHLTTPVSIAKTHYYWAFARDHGPPYDYAQMRAQGDIIFGEDIAIVEATQSMAQRSVDQASALEYSVQADRAAVEGRRKVVALVEAEANSEKQFGSKG